MSELSQDLKIDVEKILKSPILATRVVGGGSISEARSIITPSGKFFLKTNHRPDALRMLEAEAMGLEILARPDCIGVPEVYGYGSVPSTSYLILQFIEPGYQSNEFWESLGQRLALVHLNSQDTFGLDHSNFIGNLPQSNQIHKSWVSFYIEERLQPQLDLSINSNLLAKRDADNFEALYQELPNLLPQEKPSLIHGDLWSGNFLCNAHGEPYLIDPAVCFGSREMDLAMSKLFGGFSPQFYHSYHQYFPLQPGFDQRMEIYQLYYLLVHVNLFGLSYVPSVRKIIAPYEKRV